MDIPDGFVLVRRGGRPPKKARDMAVFMMKLLMVDECGGKAAVFELEAIKLFGLANEAEVRSRVRKAKRVHREWICSVMNKSHVLILPCNIHQHTTKRVKGWFWTHGMVEAVQIQGTLKISLGTQFFTP